MTESQFLDFIAKILRNETVYNHKCEVAIDYYIHKQRIWYQLEK